MAEIQDKVDFWPIRKVTTTDGFPLHGIFVSSLGAQRTLIHTHGTGGNFFWNDFYPNIANACHSSGVSFLAVNSRGSGIVELEKGSPGAGISLEIFEDCLKDIDAWIEFAISQGSKSVVLEGHSFGIGKVTVGKILLFLYLKLGILSKPVYREEELGRRPKVFPTKLPGALSLLAINQLTKLGKFNNHRKKITNFYFQNLKDSEIQLPSKKQGAIWMRFPITTENMTKIFNCAKKKGVLLGDWYKEVVVPVKDLYIVGYEKGCCPNAQKLAGKILNLPTYPSLSKKQASEVVQLVKSCQNSK